MSVLAAVTDGRRAWMAADSRVTLCDGTVQRLHPRGLQKVQRVASGLLVGIAGPSGLAAAFLRDITGVEHTSNPWPDFEPWTPEPEGLEVYLEERLPSIRAFVADWCTGLPGGPEDVGEFELLAAYGPSIATLTLDGSIVLHAEPYDAIGCGAPVAKGVLGALLAVQVDAETAVRLAVDLACRHVPECGPPVVVLSAPESEADVPPCEVGP